jgi:hypothetical protein
MRGNMNREQMEEKIEDIKRAMMFAGTVRCIDCEYHRHDDWCTELHRETKQNDYCSWGVKKDE